MDSQVQSQIDNQPRVTTAGEGTNDVKQKEVVSQYLGSLLCCTQI